ncbi:peptidase inhibitor family I36 protein [Nocardiopsis composta]|uniref:Uncharacterized protein n=1 Tax=Nocardiopsis composta TaxID=157465 RepID=A0A7W8VBQ1_9ACTN|nr:peptidase inhibitor family I36 protein [Nocardiopsis composta]MBB5430571.1 hypothetical protein [Nocardiopsis composta]
MRRKLLSTAGAAALVAAAFFGTAAPAAAEGVEAQAARSLHVYEHDNFKGRSAHITKNDGNFKDNYWKGTKASISQNISSFKNKGDRRAILYSGTGHTGTAYTAKGHSEDKDLSKNSNNPSNFDNKARSVKFVI